MAEFSKVGECSVDAAEVFDGAVVRVNFTAGWRFKAGMFCLRLAVRILRMHLVIERE